MDAGWYSIMRLSTEREGLNASEMIDNITEDAVTLKYYPGVWNNEHSEHC